MSVSQISILQINNGTHLGLAMNNEQDLIFRLRVLKLSVWSSNETASTQTIVLKKYSEVSSASFYCKKNDMIVRTYIKK